MTRAFWHNISRRTTLMRLLLVVAMVSVQWSMVNGQIKIGGTVYGGGNEGNVGGSTSVTVTQGDLNKVFGGARQANIGGNSYVNIDGAHAEGYTLINYVFGGNDIAGTIGTAAAVGESLPAELTGNTDGVDNTWNTYVRLSSKLATEDIHYTQEEIDAAGSGDPAYGKTTSDVKVKAGQEMPGAEKCFIGWLFTGGNGDYFYDSSTEGGKTTTNVYEKEGDATPITTVVTDEGISPIPDLDKTYLDLQGGTITFAHGGGNNATVKEKAVIHMDNPSDVIVSITDPDHITETNPTGELLTDDRVVNGMNMSLVKEHYTSKSYQIGRLFGGNNKAEMAIRPTWNLQSGLVRHLYSGGNSGAMTSPEGLLLELDPLPTNVNPLTIFNVYGGCRMADVCPKVNGIYTPCTNLQDKDDQGNLIYKFPNELAARVLVRGGNITNVYGGNDVTGKVYGGNAVGIYTTISGDVYGGGNGAYAYTDMLEDDPNYGDYYFPSEMLGNGLDALNAYRPNAEQVSIRLKGKDADHPTIIKGSVFCGGNCATLSTTKSNPMVELKIGSHVWADKLFLGNNGASMVDKSILEQYADRDYSTINLTDESVFAQYMEGVTMSLEPDLVFDDVNNGDPDTYVDKSSKVGSFYCGGNVGSMAIGGKNNYLIDRPLVIFEKFVAGCNSADVEATELNAPYEGGILGSEDERNGYTDSSGKIKDRIELTLDNMVIIPQRWNDTFTKVTVKKLVEGQEYFTDIGGGGAFYALGTEEVTADNQYYEKVGESYVAVNPNTLNAGQEYYATNVRTSKFVADGTEVFTGTGAKTYYELTAQGYDLEWNTVVWDDTEDGFMATGTEGDGVKDEDRRFLGGNVYGGCYNSGHVNGNVIININRDLIQKDEIFAEAAPGDGYTIGDERRSGVLREAQRDDLMAAAMMVFGAGYGKETEIWGSTTVNLNNGYVFQVFGGGEEGVVGKKDSNGEYTYNAAYSSTVNLKGPNAGYADDETGPALAEAEYIYAGGNEGDVCGNSYAYLGNGRAYGVFGGSSNADIYGGTEVHIGYNGGFPWIGGNVYAGNDFGGTIKGKINHTTATLRAVFDVNMLQSSTYLKYIQGRVDSIFGGSYGCYDYTDGIFRDYTYTIHDTEELPQGKELGDPKEGFNFPNLLDNSFVHFVPSDNANNSLAAIFGGSQGYPGISRMNNSMQKESYVLIDDTQTKDANRFANVDIYGGGAFAGVGSSESLGGGRTAVDLYAGSFNNVYGGCNQEGLVGYTRVNVPSGSTLKVNSLFGGGKGYDLNTIASTPVLAARYCDNYVTCVDFKSQNAIVNDAIYGGNQNCRISCDTYINIEASVLQSNGYQGTIYGAGYGKETVSGRTNIFMNNGAVAYKVFGGGRDGNAFNFSSLRQWLASQFLTAGVSPTDVAAEVEAYGGILRTFGTYLVAHPISLPDKTGTYLNASGAFDGTYTNDILLNPNYHQTNVHLMNGSNVTGYAYGGGFGTDAVVGGTTYVELKGGTVDRDIYGGGQGGSVYDEFELAKDDDHNNDFVASTNVYIEGGMVRNVYGGGYQGHVGLHEGDIAASTAGDIPGVANLTIGKVNGTSFYDGIPAIQRNAYGGGEGGSVYGTANVTLNDGYIGYRYKNTATSGAPVYEYVEELDDQKPNSIEMAGNIFGGGYVVNSYVDNANVNMYGGTVRGSLYGGGEVGPIGRGTMKAGATMVNGGIQNGLAGKMATIYKAGKTNVKMFNGLVKRNVFGGGRGKDSWGGDGTMYMDSELIPTLDLDCKGFVFGQTEVSIHGGEVGTDEGMALGYGNVFGGCDEGSVYSAYENDNGILCIGKKQGDRYDDNTEGYYFKYENGTFPTVHSGVEDRFIYTEDCKVLVEPWLQVKNTPITYDSKTYNVGDYVPTAYLNTLKAKEGDTWPTGWDNVDVGTVAKERGIHVHNAVFAGGNIAAGSSSMYANEVTVFGNATASIHDIYNRDLITIGTGHTGGLYGDGNLTFVDGYRELNITNYGTDKFHLVSPLTIEQYRLLPGREQAYYEPKYECATSCTDNAGTTYSVGSSLPYDELTVLFLDNNGNSLTVNGTAVMTWDSTNKKWVPNETFWKEKGVVSTYAGRIMNTIQRADFCGVFGSRMVMKGAEDRVPETVDFTHYTINRVREVSLNKMDSPAGDTDADNVMHGNYFGIYSNVNFLGALTSDVNFHTAVRTTNRAEDDLKGDGTTTFAQWKEAHKADRKRNNGNCYNQLALASGVYLELTTEKKNGKTLETKDWGLITGVVELDLINVQTGIGGGFVYAKNEHGVPTTGHTNNTLTALNQTAASKWAIGYDETDATKKEWQTSGNFIHSSQTIIDDCYNISNRYKGDGAVPAHYWYVSGQVYVYDQYISAHTGTPNAYSEKVEIPITINAASNGTMRLMDVQPNLYAYYSSYSNESANTKLEKGQKLVINDVTYELNSPISYWDWYKLPKATQNLFVDETYVTTAECTTTVGTSKYPAGTYPAGTVLLPADYEALRAAHNPDLDNEIKVHHTDKDEDVDFDFVFRSSNNLSHGKGYILSYQMTNPSVWDQWYTKVDSNTKQQVPGDGFEDGPTYHPTESGLYGRKEYAVADIIPKTVYDTYTTAVSTHSLSPDGAATFVQAHIVTSECNDNSGTHYYPGAALPNEISGHTSPAYICTSTIKLSDSEYIFANQLMSESDKTAYYNRFHKTGATEAELQIADDINSLIKPAYYCTVAGLYGGDYYETTKNYRALNAWSSMSEDDRNKFEFNYDALDLLIDPNYEGTAGLKYQYDSKDATKEGAQANLATYSLPTPIDYMATYQGDTDATPHNGITLTKGLEYTRSQYEQLPNEQRHYAPIIVNEAGDYYVIKNDFIHIETPYAAGTTINVEEYNRLTSSEKAENIAILSFEDSEVAEGGSVYYFCRESYEVDEKTEGVSVTNVKGTSTAYSNGNTVPVGTVINSDNYARLKNYQKNFIIHGESPSETSTLFVSRNSDINDLSTEKIITVIYKYDYEESDASGLHITPVSERHVVNIHITFRSGVPIIEDIQQPNIVLPGNSIVMRVPTVTPGAYEILGGGWELFDTENHAESHFNGVEYTPSSDSLYWFQDGFYLAYYAKTYLGKSYSNHVPVSVANYHDLKKVMDDKTHHLHVDYDRTRLKRDSKVYINNYSGSSPNGLDLLKSFFDLSTGTTIEGHTPLNISTETGTNIYDGTTNTKGVKGCKNLEFILRTDIDHTAPSGSPALTWTPIGTSSQCFEGTLHGDGHTISGLAPATGTTGSLFGKLCGSVYNLGVTGSFTGAGVADTGDGYVESCWVKSTVTTPSGEGTKPYAVFGSPSDGNGYQVVNSYFWKGNSDLYNSATTEDVTKSGGERGKALAMETRDFYNGTLAYNLNNFYLYKRYNDHTAPSGSPAEYKYWKSGIDTPQTGYYASKPDLCSSGYNGHLKYVEDRFADGDFRYAAGSIPTYEEERLFIDTEDENKEYFFPIWPDDYLFFGQKLTYGYATDAHQEVPTAVVRFNGLLSPNEDANRVYRAPAYFGSDTLGVTHFNPDVYLAQKSKDGTKEAYPGMTAIDFAGHNGNNVANGTFASGFTVPGGSPAGAAPAVFYLPLLDDDGLQSITNCDETQNLLVYAPAKSASSGYANASTYNVLTGYFVDPAYSDYYDKNDVYRRVGDATTASASVYGHLVMSNLTATSDHLLVDKQDFNAPISYTFAADKRMWYQRKPDDKEYVEPVWAGDPAVRSSKGWQGISIPFTAELVSTNDKGEITHFFGNSETSKNGTGKKIGHEYWLRGFTNIKSEGEQAVAKADFTYPAAAGDNKTVTNTFLWDYYYKNTANQKDKNDDTYQTYYQNSRTYTAYPLLNTATPYILGLPGSTYYEFDLSGNFVARNTKVTIPQLSRQVITFASAPGITIGVSDNDIRTATTANTKNGYAFVPTFMRKTIAAGSNAYTMSADGDRYDKVSGSEETTVEAFRPYFRLATNASRPDTRSIIFANSGGEEQLQHEGHGNSDEQGTIIVRSERHKILVTSTLRNTVTIRVLNTNGITLNTFELKPGETVETRVNVSGVYMVQTLNGQFIKKIAVR